ncbi:MAG TPA: hypothetical protein VMM54_09260 [Nitrospirota bacterium]|nr:hypothetical protein [Nitrospirota bacterium]
MAAYGPTLTLRILMAAFLILALNFVTEVARADQEPPITIDQMMAHLSFDKSHKEALLDGKILSTGMPEMEQLRHELGVAAVMLVVKVPMKKVVAAYLDGESFRQNSDIIEYKMIRSTRKSSPAEEENFKPIGFTEEESSEVKKLLNFKGGETFNFSPDEIKQFQVINPKDSAVRDKVSLLLRRILVERYRSYLIQGLEAVKPYDRGRGKHSYPRKELTAAVGSTKLLESHFPDFYQSLLKYPEEVDKSIANEFYWFKTKMDNRPAFQLSHYMADIRSHYGVVAELQFYVEHTYNSMLTTIGCVPYEGGTVVFCANRTFTDQVAGFGSSLKRPVGRRRVEDAISEHFAKLRSVLESH